MRRHLLSMTVAGLVGVLASSAAGGIIPDIAQEAGISEKEAAIDPAPIATQRIAVPSVGLRDEAAMVLIGTALIGLAAVVRRAT
jgi:hypothetical protein